MTSDLYEQLASSLDELPAGFPRTASGVEIRILRRLFSPEEAALALHLTVIPEEPRVIAARAHLPVEEAARLLEGMDRKRLVYSTAKDGQVRYMAVQFVVGIWEGQVDRLSPELVHDFEEYLPTLFEAETWRKAPQMRIVPVNSAIDARTEVMPYEIVAELLRSGHGDYAVSNCICRQEMKLVGKGCDRPMESCLSLGSAAHSITRSGRGWAITREEALEILRHADDSGLVLQASNSKHAVFICTCCGCCCGVLRSIKRHPAPAQLVSSPFVAVLDASSCEGCGTCTTRCQMDALDVTDGTASLDETRCIGCGLCVNTCPTESLSLRRKPPSQQPRVPASIVESYLQVGRARGRYGVGELVGLQLRSIVDRWRA